VSPPFLAAQGSPEKKLKSYLAAVSRNLHRFQETVAALPATAPNARGEDGLLEILTQRWGWEKGLDGAAVILDAEIGASRRRGKFWPGGLILIWPVPEDAWCGF